MSDRYYVSLTATCDEEYLSDLLDRMQTAMKNVAVWGNLDGLSLSFTRDDGEVIRGEVVTALPVAGPLISTGPGTPPPDAVDMPVVEPEIDRLPDAEDTGPRSPVLGQHEDDELPVPGQHALDDDPGEP